PPGLVLSQPHVNRLTRHSEPGRHISHRLTVGDHRPHGLIPLLSHRQLPHEPEVSPTNRSRCNPSAETPSPISRRPTGRYQPRQYKIWCAARDSNPEP